MTLDEAIEIGEGGRPTADGYSHWDFDFALALLVKAGKDILAHRQAHPSLQRSLLPGETEK